MKFKLTSEFGALEEVRGGRIHTGVDIGTPLNTELRSIGDGVVEKVFDGSGAIGEGVKIRLEDGTHAIYGHMNDVYLEEGSKVIAGQTIGLSGSTGHSTGPHLHFSLENNGEFIDPTNIADELAAISGSNVDMISVFKAKGALAELIGGGIKEKAKETTKEVFIGIAEGLLEIVMDSLYAFTLIGTTVLLLLRVYGYTPANKYLGLLPLSFVLIRYLFGGV